MSIKRNYSLVLVGSEVTVVVRSYIIRNFGKPTALLATCFTQVSCLANSLTLNMEATCSSEMSTDFQRRYIPKIDFCKYYLDDNKTLCWVSRKLHATIGIFYFQCHSVLSLTTTMPFLRDG
jgi:hypothetical protein